MILVTKRELPYSLWRPCPNIRSREVERPFIGLAEIAADAALRDLREVAVLGNLDDKATSVAFSPDGQRIVTVLNREARISDSVYVGNESCFESRRLRQRGFQPGWPPDCDWFRISDCSSQHRERGEHR